MDAEAPRDGRRPPPVSVWPLTVLVAFMRLSIVAVVASLAGAVLMFVIGAVSTYDAVRGYLQDHSGDGKSVEGGTATVEVVAALDEFLFGLLLLVFAAGVAQLFLLGDRVGAASPLPRWMHVTGLTELKIKLLELIVVVLVVQFFRFILGEYDQIDWPILVVPIAIGIFGLVIWVLRPGTDGSEPE